MPINHQIVPPNGWRFLEPKSNITIISLDWNSLVKGVIAHRKSNGIDVGDVELDIDNQIEKNHPHLSV